MNKQRLSLTSRRPNGHQNLTEEGSKRGESKLPAYSITMPVTKRSSCISKGMHKQNGADFELAHLPMASAKPSEIRKAAAGARLKAKAEQDKARERERKAREQQLKMQRYRDEIARIKKAQEEQEAREREAERNAELEATNKPALSAAMSQEMTSKVLGHEVTDFRENAVLGYSGGSSMCLDEDEDADGSEKEKGKGKDVVTEMQQSFARIGSFGKPGEVSNASKMPAVAEESDMKNAEFKKQVHVSTAAMTLSSEPHRRREFRSDRKGRLRKESKRHFSIDKKGVIATDSNGFVRKAPTRNPSNRVPEMRRRAMNRDLLFDDEQPKPFTKISGKASTGPGPGGEANFKKLSQKRDEEKQRFKEQKKKLEEADEAFKAGHNLCWTVLDSASALGEYRKALFIRESMLGKYHEQTGRTYFWIGKSLAKLREFSEALVAFSRAMRIFDRVVTKKHKYHKWTVLAIQNCIEGVEDEDIEYKEYMSTLEASIKHEREGDAYRKKGERAAAVAKYRDAIDEVEEYHPDAADLYCKIALILRQDGDFERALEEYRFASEIYELSLGADHPETVKALNQVMEKKRLGQLSNLLMEKLNLSRGGQV